MSDILIATDGSKYSDKAVDYGIALAVKLGARAHVLYVINQRSLELYALGHHDDIEGYEMMNATLKEEGETALSHAIVLSKEAGVEVTVEMAKGYPANEIVAMAAKKGVSMIILGNLGKTGLEHLLIGSVSEAVVKKAPCPVLVVRGKTPLP